MKNRRLIENGFVGLSTIVLGIMAGLFWTYTFNVNYAMLEVDGETYATVQSLLNENVRHFIFFFFFFGGGFFSVLAVIANFRNWRRFDFWLLLTGCLIYIFGVIYFTRAVNLPLNYTTEAWDPQNLPADWTSVRDAWNRANAFRVFTSVTPFVLNLGVLIARASFPITEGVAEQKTKESTAHRNVTLMT